MASHVNSVLLLAAPGTLLLVANCFSSFELHILTPHPTTSKRKEILPMAPPEDEKVPLSLKLMLHQLYNSEALFAYLWTNPCGQGDWIASRLETITAKCWNWSWTGTLRLSGHKVNKNRCWKDNKQMSTSTVNKELSNFQNIESPLTSKMEMRAELIQDIYLL